MAEVTRVRVELQEQNGRLQAELTAQEALKEKAAALERQLKGELSSKPPMPSLWGLSFLDHRIGGWAGGLRWAWFQLREVLARKAECVCMQGTVRKPRTAPLRASGMARTHGVPSACSSLSSLPCSDGE